MYRHIWTSDDREEWVRHATTDTAYKGIRNGLKYRLIPKLGGEMTDDPRRSLMTEATAQIVYKMNPKYRCLSLGFYAMLIEKINANSFAAKYIWRCFMVLVKGSNAYALLIPGHPDMNFSDTDIVISINPFIDETLFDELSVALRIIVCQTMSQFKKTMDHMFFLENPDPSIKYMWMDNATIEQFKADHVACMNEIGMVSVFEAKAVRNHCSRHSFMLANSEAHPDRVAKIEVPHFNKCDRIPLRFTPIFCSVNDTIAYETENVSRAINLFRIKWNNMMIEELDEVRLRLKCDEEAGTVSVTIDPAFIDDSIAADFIDIIIAKKTDSDLIDFWTTGKCACVFDPASCVWVAVPDLSTCADDLHKMLTVYDCPESKREKRQRKYDVINSFIPKMLHCPLAPIEGSDCSNCSDCNNNNNNNNNNNA